MWQRLLDLARPYRSVIIAVLMFISVGVGLKVYTTLRLKQAQEKLQQADQFRAEGEKLRADAEKLRAQSLLTQAALDKANAKLEKLQAAVDKIKVPDAPTSLPATTGATLADLRSMGLELVIKPSTQLAPAVAGITNDDAGKVWFWGKQTLRIAPLELKIEKQVLLVDGLTRAKTLAESLAEQRTKEADVWHGAADKKEQEALAVRAALTDTQSALKAERRKKILYAVGSAALTYAVTRK